MTPTETAQIIAYIDARLGRTSQRNPLQVEAWHEDLARFDYADVREAAHTLTLAPALYGVGIGDLMTAVRKRRQDLAERRVVAEIHSDRRAIGADFTKQARARGIDTKQIGARP
jgi:hypothetical protein